MNSFGGLCLALTLLLTLGACSPTLNWRQVHAEHAQGLQLWLPCSPQAQVRPQPLVGFVHPVALHVLSCQAGGATWALRWVDLGQAQDPTLALGALQASLEANLRQLSGQTSRAQALHMPAWAESPSVGQLSLAGQRWGVPGPSNQADAAPTAPKHPGLVVDAWHFSHAQTAFEASVWREQGPLASALHDQDLQTFVQGFQFPG